MIKFRTRTRPQNLQKAISDMPRAVRGIATEAAGEYLIGDAGGRRGLRHYAKKRPGQKYVRTYALRRGWQMDAKGAKTTVYNNVPYARYVQGLKQAWMHAGRWRTWLQVAKDNTKGMIRAVDLALNRWLKEKGLK